jgi:hypothetical protein
LRKDYVPVVAPRPVPTLGGGFFHYRPVMAVQLTGPRRSLLRDCLLDSGSDETVFQESLAIHLGIDLTGADERQIGLVGRPGSDRCRYTAMQLRISDGPRETYEWTAVVGFAATPLHYGILGQGGFLQFFDVEFRGADRAVVLIPNASFPGTQVVMPARP